MVTQLGINFNGKADNNPPSTPFTVQMAVKNNLDVFYFQVPCMLSVLLQPSPSIDAQQFQAQWQTIANEISHQIKLHESY